MNPLLLPGCCSPLSQHHENVSIDLPDDGDGANMYRYMFISLFGIFNLICTNAIKKKITLFELHTPAVIQMNFQIGSGNVDISITFKVLKTKVSLRHNVIDNTPDLLQ